MTDQFGDKTVYKYNNTGWQSNETTGKTWVNPGVNRPLKLVTICYDADGDVSQIKDANSNYQYTYNADDEVDLGKHFDNAKEACRSGPNLG